MSHDPLVGKVIDGRYEIQARVGEGGMGVVYKSRQISIDRIIALKMLNQQMASDPNWVQRFYNEAKACSRLQHPNTIRMFDFGQTSDGRLFMTMEFLDGMSLRDAVDKGPLTPQRVVKILIQCCASLAEAHSIGIIHRDIKPDNVFLLNMAGSPDFVKVLDFSVAKLLEGDRLKTQAGVVFGTPQYMSPEQGRGLPLDARSDLYALGILAYEMLTGSVPFHDENPMIVINMHQQAQLPPMPDSIPYSVQSIVRRVLEKDPGRRYQSAGEMMQHCQQVFAEVSQSGMSVGAGGMPKTMIAGGVPPMVQQAAAQMQQQPPYQQASAGQKTMVAQASPFHQGGQQQPHQPGMPMQGNPQMGGLQQGGYAQASANQKTMIAGLTPPINPMDPNLALPPGAQTMRPGMHQAPAGFGQPGMPQGMQQHGMQPQGMQQHGMHPQGMQPQGGGMQQQGGGPARTVAIQASEGVVSLAGRDNMNANAGAAPEGASGLFWFLSLVTGIGIGVLAYVIVLQVM